MSYGDIVIVIVGVVFFFASPNSDPEPGLEVPREEEPEEAEEAEAKAK
jgi:hypothetical protein